MARIFYLKYYGSHIYLLEMMERSENSGNILKTFCLGDWKLNK